MTKTDTLSVVHGIAAVYLLTVTLMLTVCMLTVTPNITSLLSNILILILGQLQRYPTVDLQCIWLSTRHLAICLLLLV